VRRHVARRSYYRDLDDQYRREKWYDEQNKDKQWIEENSMAKYTQVFDGFLNDNSEGVQKNNKAPKYRSSGSGKSAIVATQDIPKGSVIAFAAWGGKGQYGPYIKLSGQLVEADHMPQQQAPQGQTEGQHDFDDEIPFNRLQHEYCY